MDDLHNQFSIREVNIDQSLFGDREEILYAIRINSESGNDDGRSDRQAYSRI